MFKNAISFRRLFNLGSEALWVFIGQAGTAIAGLIGIKLLTNVLGPSEFGRLVLANTIIAFIGMNLFGPFGQGLMRFWAISKNRGFLDAYYSISDYLAKYITLIVFILSTIVIFLYIAILHKFNWVVLSILSIFIGIISGNITLKIGIFTGARQRKHVALLNISNAFLRPLIATLLVVLTISNANVALVGYLLTTIIVFLVAKLYYSQNTSHIPLSQLNSKREISLFKGLGREIFLFSLLFLFWGIFTWIKTYCDRWALQLFHGSEVVGLFAVISRIALFLVNFNSGLLTTFFNPIAFQHAGNLDNAHSLSSAKKVLTIMIVLYILNMSIIIGIFSIFHQSLVLLISDRRYIKFSSLLPWLTATLAFYHLGEMLVSFGALLNQLKAFFLPKIISSIVAAIFIFFFVSKIGPLGIVWAFVFSSLVYTPWCLIICWRFGKETKL